MSNFDRFMKRLTLPAVILYLIAGALLGVAAYFTIRFFADSGGAVGNMLIALGFIAAGWYLGAVATKNLPPDSENEEYGYCGDDEYKDDSNSGEKAE